MLLQHYKRKHIPSRYVDLENEFITAYLNGVIVSYLPGYDANDIKVKLVPDVTTSQKNRLCKYLESKYLIKKEKIIIDGLNLTILL